MESNALNFNLFNSLILAGIIQGFVFGAVVISRKYNAHGIKYLLGLIVTFSLNNLQYYLQDSGIISSQALFSTIYIPFQLLTGVLFLFYGLSLIATDGKLPGWAKWALLPFTIALLLAFGYKILFAVGLVTPAVQSFFGLANVLAELTAIVMDIGFVVYLLLQIRRIENNELPSAKLTPQLKWFKIILVVFFFLSLLWAFNAFVSTVYSGGNPAYYPTWIGMSIMIYWMGHVGIYKFGMQQQHKSVRGYLASHKTGLQSLTQKNEHIVALEKLLVGEKLFLDPTLTLDKITAQLPISKSHLSRTINAELGMGFPDYLNKLRVEEAKNNLRNPDFANYTLVAIGLEAGFNSKTTFNTAFKKLTAQTPSEYRRSVAEFETSQNSVA